ncbi:hypothetical protein BC828DRAFT_26311 [Blastocladiella britannica]|nr:hypothetical protein BC828DRAFT_26311 [Blastocladiella britannica]
MVQQKAAAKLVTCLWTIILLFLGYVPTFSIVNGRATGAEWRRRRKKWPFSLDPAHPLTRASQSTKNLARKHWGKRFDFVLWARSSAWHPRTSKPNKHQKMRASFFLVLFALVGTALAAPAVSHDHADKPSNIGEQCRAARYRCLNSCGGVCKGLGDAEWRECMMDCGIQCDICGM